jgi:hypothetical protein
VLDLVAVELAFVQQGLQKTKQPRSCRSINDGDLSTERKTDTKPHAKGLDIECCRCTCVSCSLAVPDSCLTSVSLERTILQNKQGTDRISAACKRTREKSERTVRT